MWLIFAYSLPGSNPKGRVKVWRKLSNIGALQLKSSFYILPMSDANYEHLEWTAKEVEEMGGDAVLFKSECIENMKDETISAMFNAERESDYLRLEEKIRKHEAKLTERGTSKDKIKKELKREIKKITKEFSAIKEIDYFSSDRGEKTEILLASFANRLGSIEKGEEGVSVIEPLNIKAYKSKTWATRKGPYIDRMASYWLIKRFIDDKARIRFVSASDVKKKKKNSISFDIKGGDFTHQGNRVTFEVIAESFGIRDKGIEHIGKIVHALDLKDDVYYSEDSKGVEDVIKGIIRISKDDHEVMEKGLLIFDALYGNCR